MNYSRQRELIFNYLKNTKAHPTAEMVYADLKKEHPNLSLATVYRNLNQMCEAGMVRRLCVANSPDRFDATVAEHHHLVCSNCAKVLDIEPSHAFIDCCAQEYKRYNHKIDFCEVSFYGICEHCQDKLTS